MSKDLASPSFSMKEASPAMLHGGERTRLPKAVVPKELLMVSTLVAVEPTGTFPKFRSPCGSITMVAGGFLIVMAAL